MTASPWIDSVSSLVTPDLRDLAKWLPENYRALTSPPEAAEDLNLIMRASQDAEVTSRIYQDKEQVILTVASPKGRLTLSKAVPVLEYAGFDVITENAFEVTSTSLFIHRYLLQPRGKITFPRNTSSFLGGINAIISGAAANDPLNGLLLAGISLFNLTVFRAYGSLLSQMNKFATRHAIFNALASNPDAALLLVEYFDTKFNPLRALSVSERTAALQALEGSIRDVIRAIKDLSHDRIIRAILDLVHITVRTNAYGLRQGIPLALKVHTQRSEIAPAPKPLFEIFVYGPTVEGVHLRSAMVSRGGIRWSDRKDDYRTEVLGLMKTQRVKNVVIVPSGSKGGFIPKTGDGSREAAFNSYRDYIRALLSVTDNIVAGKIVPPEGVIRHDGDDPYLVVAADKGTATFSDTANGVAVDEFAFWLGDAFASGGSVGYDHKKFGITARGVWECAKRHFREAGIPFDTGTFSAIGIGDMSGDVFGNGLLLSERVTLVAAFDHRSIFLDPSPDPRTSFTERKRLFELKGSSWGDYRRDLISAGGGIFARTDKEIHLSAQVRTALGLTADTPPSLDGESLIQAILKAPVDLIWNGGIGTYVKSKEETHGEVNDSSNDTVRINGEEVRAKVFAEGGNLGVTSKGRNEFSLRGGHINTDAIDNSAGVDLSDHEVNIKILLNAVERRGGLTREQRNQLLKEMGPEVAAAVLKHNADQALTISLGVHRSRRNLEYYRALVNALARDGYIHRSLDPLPDDDEFSFRTSKNQGLTRPELALCLAFTKMWVKDALLKNPSHLRDPWYEPLLLRYFPETLQQRFATDILNHSLRDNIIATELTNLVVDTFGISFVHRLGQLHGASVPRVIAAAYAASQLFASDKLLVELLSLDTSTDAERFLQAQLEIRRALRATAGWFVTSTEQLCSRSCLEAFSSQLEVVCKHPERFLSSSQLAVAASARDRYPELASKQHCHRILTLGASMVNVLEILRISTTLAANPEQVAQVYISIVDALSLTPFITLGAPVHYANRWENELRITAHEQIRQAVSRIAASFVSHQVDHSTARQRLAQAPGAENLGFALKDLIASGMPSAGLAVCARNLSVLADQLT